MEENQNIVCPKCNQTLSNDSIFCTSCGYKLKQNKIFSFFKSKKMKIIMIILAIILIVTGVIAELLYYGYVQKCKEPYSTSWTFGDTDTSVYASYNSKYHIINLDLTLNETVEQWQIDEMGTNSANVKITCSTPDGIKKEFNFNNMTMQVGKNIKGKQTIEKAKLKDFVMVKEALQGNATISYSKYLALDSKERANLKNEHYKRLAEEKRAQEAADAMSTLGGLMMLNMMLGG